MTGDAWDTDLGQWTQAWWAYLRGDVALVADAPNSPEKPDGSIEDADAAFAREIALAKEVCDDQVKGDAATAFMPDVPLPFGGEVKSD